MGRVEIQLTVVLVLFLLAVFVLYPHWMSAFQIKSGGFNCMSRQTSEHNTGGTVHTWIVGKPLLEPRPQVSHHILSSYITMTTNWHRSVISFTCANPFQTYCFPSPVYSAEQKSWAVDKTHLPHSRIGTSWIFFFFFLHMLNVAHLILAPDQCWCLTLWETWSPGDLLDLDILAQRLG